MHFSVPPTSRHLGPQVQRRLPFGALLGRRGDEDRLGGAALLGGGTWFCCRPVLRVREIASFVWCSDVLEQISIDLLHIFME